jgi:peptide/nickel transport system ATP-binding protein
MASPLLEVTGLKTYFFTEDGVTRAVDGVSFAIAPGETLGIVGESGCGKSVAALSVLRLLPARIGRTVAGSIRFDGIDLLALSEAEMRDIRGNRIAMIFQEPMTSLNPVLTIGHQIAEALRIHKGTGRDEAREHARRMLETVRIPDAASRLDDYPHQFSGGMRQRVMIAMALACSPKLLIADEPTTALDVSVQAQVLNLMMDLQEDLGLAYLFISHDLGVVEHIGHRVAVMYLGRIVEIAGKEELFARPLHPYTRALLAAAPVPDPRARKERIVLEGDVPSPIAPPSGCHFHTRCPFAFQRCRSEEPVLRDAGGGRRFSCHLDP